MSPAGNRRLPSVNDVYYIDRAPSQPLTDRSIDRLRYAVSTDSDLRRQRTTGGGLQDIFTATVQHKTLGGGTSAAVKLALAGVVGLLLVGLLLLVIGLGSRRSQRGPSAKHERTGAPQPTRVG